MRFSAVASARGTSAVMRPLGQGVDAVAETDQLGKLAGDDDDALALAREPVDDPVDLVLRPPTSMPRVGSSRMSTSGGRVHPLRQHDLLLVAAGELADDRLDRAGLDVHALPVRLGDDPLPALVDPADLGDPVEGRDGDVPLDVVDEVQPVPLAVLRGIRQAVVDRLRDGLRGDLGSALVDPAGDVHAVAAPEHAHRELGAPRAHDPRDADDLPLAHEEVRAVHDLALVVEGMVHRPVLDPQQLAADLGRAVGGTGWPGRGRPCRG